jgi:hypothetical protein
MSIACAVEGIYCNKRGCLLGDDAENILLLCDYYQCKIGTHICCLLVPLESVPTVPWYCPLHALIVVERKWWPYSNTVTCRLRKSGIEVTLGNAAVIDSHGDGSLTVQDQNGGLERVCSSDWHYPASLRQSVGNGSVHGPEGFKYRLCVEGSKGLGMLLEADVVIHEVKQVLLVGPRGMNPDETSGFPFDVSDMFHVEWGRSDCFLYTNTSKKMEPDSALMVVNTADVGASAGYNFATVLIDGVWRPCLQSRLKRGEVHRANTFVNVKYYATSGSLSTKAMQAESNRVSLKEKVCDSIQVRYRAANLSPSSLICRRCFLVLPNQKPARRAHVLNCGKPLWTITVLAKFNVGAWVASLMSKQ